jgi:EAL domain-containing protein (putative c-di-GMP-specific phosphodiesterase class I)
MSDPLATLEGYDVHTGRVLHLPIHSFPCRIGRRTEIELPLYDPRVSQLHAEIFQDRDDIYIRDLASTNGTFVNGNKVTEPTLLRSGDVIRLAVAEFRFVYGESSMPEDAEQTAIISGETLDRQLFAHRDFLDLFDQQKVVPFYQPIVQLGSNELIGYEVLGRGTSESLPRSPRDLFAMAATFGMEANLSELFRAVGIRTAKMVMGELLLFVNMHPAEVGGMQLIHSLTELREECPAVNIVLELHESAMTDVHRLRELRNQLSELGIGLAYDDFGAGQARLNELAEVPPDFVKFDVSLVRQIHDAPPAKKQLVARLVQFAKDLGAQTLAEGVELPAERDYCEEMGFDLAQGYQFGKPEPIEQTLGPAGS